MALDPVTAILDIGGKVMDRLWPDPAQAAAAKLELFKLQQSGELAQIVGQMEIDKEEAKSSSVLVAGWRPFLGWVCGAAFAYKFVMSPLLVFIFIACGHPIVLPVLDFSEMNTVLMGMLGLAGMRTYEKVKDVAS